MYIDTHAHIYTPQFADEYDDIISRAVDVGVERIIMPNIDLTTVESMMELSRRYPQSCLPMIGLHPCSVTEAYLQDLDSLQPYLEDQEVVGVGEIGIDLYWDKTFVKAQKDAFRIQVNWARERQVPIAIHSRDSIEMTIDIITEMQDGRLRGIFHCFTSGSEEAKRIVNLGFHVGIGGVATFKKSTDLRKTIASIPMDSIVLETDAPYLSPSPYRGKRNESSYLPHIAEVVSTSKETSLEEVRNRTTENAKTLFGL
ncbi:MAG: TatD family hydrolase [Bacteroidota bacterium]